MYSLAALEIFLEKRFLSSGCFSNNTYILNNIFCCSVALYYLLYNHIWYHIKYLKYTKNIPDQFFHYLLYYFKPDTFSMIISVVKDKSFNYKPIHFKINIVNENDSFCFVSNLS